MLARRDTVHRPAPLPHCLTRGMASQSPAGRPTSPLLLAAFVILYAKAIEPERLRNLPGLCVVMGRHEVSGAQAGIEPALATDMLPQR